MDPNPFEPPAAPVADPALPRRPLAVRVACQLLLLSLVLGLATYLPGIRVDRPEDAEIPLFVTIGMLGFFLGLSLLLIAKCHEGRNWARWVNLAYLALGWWLGAEDIGAHFQTAPLAALMEIVSMAMEMGACWLLMTGIGHYWFGQLARARARPG
jgi:hypothetical protein